MRAKIYERRKRLLDLRSAGVPMSMAVRQLAQDFNVFPDTVWNDWTRRDTWETEIYQIQDSQKHLNQLLFEMEQLKEKAFSLITTASHDNAKVGAIKQAVEIIVLKIELLQSLGLAPKVAQKIDLSVAHDITDLLREYETAVERADIRENNSPEQVDSSSASPETS